MLVEERVLSEVPLHGIRPRHRSGAWPSLLSQDGKDGCRGLPECARGKQPKGTNSVLIAFRDVLGPTVNELLRCALHFHPATQPFVFGPKRDASFRDAGDATLRDGWAPYVATSVSQETLFGLEGLNLDAPPPFLLMNEHGFHLVNGHLCLEQTRPQGCADQLDHGFPPKLHQRVAAAIDAGHPGARGVVQR